MTLVPHIKQQFGGIVWRMEIDPVTATLFAEIRNEQEKQVSFASVNLASGKINFANLTVDERWLTGIESAYNGVLLLYGLELTGSPTHKGLTAIDAGTGATLWSDYNNTFNHLSNKGPLCFDNRIQPRKLFIMDVKTGQKTEAYNPVLHEDINTGIVLPDLLNAAIFSPGEFPELPFGNIVHQLIHNRYRIVSLHALQGKALNQLLYIFKDDRLQFSDLLTDGIQKLQPEAFVMHNQHLVWLKNKTELNVINLNKTD